MTNRSRQAAYSGKQASELSKELASVSQGKQIKSVDDALNAFDKFRNNLNKALKAGIIALIYFLNKLQHTVFIARDI